MKKILAVVATIVLLTTNGSTVGAQGYVNQQDIDVIDAAGRSVNAFDDELNKQDNTDLPTTSATAIRDLRTVSLHAFSTKLGKAYSENSVTIQQNAKTLSSAIKTVSDAKLANNNISEQQFMAYSDSYEAMNESIDRLNSSVEESNTQQSNGYLYVLIAAAALALGSIVWAFRKKETTDMKTKARRQIGYMSLLPLAGATITFVTYQLANENGGSYTVVWGIIVFGLIAYVSAIAAYVRHDTLQEKDKEDDRSKPGGTPSSSSSSTTPPNTPKPIA